MKKKRNISVWALSLLIAAGLWGYVVFYHNPPGDKTVSDIPVRFINEASLSSQDLVLVGGQGATVSVRFTGRIQNLININKDTVTAVVDLRTIRNSGTLPVEFELQGPPDMDYLDRYHVTPLVNIKVDKIIKKWVELHLDFEGDVEVGYERGIAVFDPTHIQITGPSEVLDTVSRAVAWYKPDGPISWSINNMPIGYGLYTDSGQLVDSEHITADVPDALLSVPVHMVKTVRLVVDPIEGGGLTAANAAISVMPESVRISGDPGLLSEMNTLSLGSIDLASLESDIEGETRIIQYPDGVRKMDGVETAEVTVLIHGVTTKNIETSFIIPRGLFLPDNYDYKLLSNPIVVTIRGPEEDVARVLAANVRVVADFSDVAMTPGEHRVTGTAYVDGFDTVGAVAKGYDVVIQVIPLLYAPP